MTDTVSIQPVTTRIDTGKIDDVMDDLEDTVTAVQIRAAAHTSYMTMITTYQKTNEEGNQVVRNIINGATRNQ
jgi:hypothetical protein